MKFIRWRAKVDSKNRIVIPLQARRSLDINPSEEIEIIKRDKSLIISNSNSDEFDESNLRSISKNMKEVVESN